MTGQLTRKIRVGYAPGIYRIMEMGQVSQLWRHAGAACAALQLSRE